MVEVMLMMVVIISVMADGNDDGDGDDGGCVCSSTLHALFPDEEMCLLI